jgi:hypothetical protein
VSQAACSYSWIRPPSRPLRCSCAVGGARTAPAPRSVCATRDKRHTLIKATLGSGGLVEIGEPERTFTVEPLEDPVPRELPAEPAESPASPSPAQEPIEQRGRGRRERGARLHRAGRGLADLACRSGGRGLPTSKRRLRRALARGATSSSPAVSTVHSPSPGTDAPSTPRLLAAVAAASMRPKIPKRPRPISRDAPGQTR